MKKLWEKVLWFNDWLADKLSYSLATMVMFYFVLSLVLIPLLYSQPANLVGWAAYICSVVFQGIALPVLGYTARKGSEKSDQILEHLLQIMEHINKDMDRVIELEEQEGNMESAIVIQELKKKKLEILKDLSSLQRDGVPIFDIKWLKEKLDI